MYESQHGTVSSALRGEPRDTETIRVRRFSDEAIGGGFNVAASREATFGRAVASYFAKDRITDPAGMLAGMGRSGHGQGLFDSLDPADRPMRAYSDVV
ncbi:hypothetical protein ACWGDE_07580 [Streptomyces sp. NPDC054956]